MLRGVVCELKVTYNATHVRAAASRFGVRLARPVEVLQEIIES